ncbi:MAG: D-alanyl-D-alanine carboxypeptidase/D-alanyl-D-alanine-endopeptidase, partial [bacterium]
ADDCIEITVFPNDTVGLLAEFQIDPDVDYITVINSVCTTAEDSGSQISLERDLTGSVVSIRGSISYRSEPVQLWVSIHGPSEFFLTIFKDILEAHGVDLAGSTRYVAAAQPNDPTYKILLTHASPPLRNLICITNQHSQNLYAELLLRILGAELIRRQYPRDDSNSTLLSNLPNNAFEVGRKSVQEWEARMAGNSTGFAMVDGSGLSRRNLISASGLIKVLVHMNRSPYATDFINSLATPGVGTLKNRFAGLPKGITMYAKTGSLVRVRSLSGYLCEHDEPRIAFSIICNNFLCSASEVEQTINNLCHMLALYLKED